MLVALAHLCLVKLSFALAGWSNGVAAIWPSNAVLVAYLLLRAKRDWALPTLMVLATCIVTNLGSSRSETVSILFAVANVVECSLVAYLIRRGGRPAPDLTTPRDLAMFVIACLVGVAVSGTIAGVALVSHGNAFGPSWLSWSWSDLLGLLIVVPLLLVGHQAWVSGRRPSSRQFLEGFLTLGLVAAVSAAVFAQHSRPLLFLIGPAVLLATVRMRDAGAALATMIVVLVGAVALAMGEGPVALMQASAGAKLTLLQLFFATTFLTALPIAALLAQRDRIGRRLQQNEAEFRVVVNAVSDVIFRTDVAGRWTFLNPAWERLTGFPTEESLGQSFLHDVLAEDRGPFLQRLEGLELGLFDSLQHQFRFRTADGDERWAEARIHRLEDAAGELIGSAGILTDISDRVALAALADEARRRAEHDAAAALMLAATDELTGVASRRAFMAKFDQDLAHRPADGSLAIALFDIDFFKRVNDRHGHAAGDEVLKQVAAMARACVRDRDLVGRLGGEEFAILMPGAGIEQAAAVAERLRIACATADVEIPVTISVGVAAATAGSTAAALLGEADAALYRAKHEGRNCLRLAA